MSPLFDGYVAIDWSASAKPTPEGNRENSIWIATLIRGLARPLQYPNTRHNAMVNIVALLREAKIAGYRLLCGFDFAFGYPEGTARMLTGLNDANWEHVWNLIEHEITDSETNRNDRFCAAARLNEAVRNNVHVGGEGPFWGNGLKRDIAGLPRTMPHDRWGENLPPYRRHVERLFPGESVWQLSGRGVVGSQALLGIARLNALRRDCDDVQIWPFQTLGKGRCHVFAEIYPSLIEPAQGNGVLDARQVQAVAARLQALDAEETLAERLRAPENMPASVCDEEGLFLDIT